MSLYYCHQKDIYCHRWMAQFWLFTATTMCTYTCSLVGRVFCFDARQHVNFFPCHLQTWISISQIHMIFVPYITHRWKLQVWSLQSSPPCILSQEMAVSSRSMSIVFIKDYLNQWRPSHGCRILPGLTLGWVFPPKLWVLSWTGLSLTLP